MEQTLLKPARGPADWMDTRNLFIAYGKWLNVDLTFQGFDGELESLPGKYAPPTGEILLARDASGTAVGCVAFKPFDIVIGLCEMKRLYVSPTGRHMGIGRQLVLEILAIATSAGYYEMRLDTLSHMHRAISLYRRLGFVQIDPYYETPLTNTIFFAKRLQ